MTDSFDGLVQAIKEIDQHFTSQAGKAVNTALTLRNWLIGAYLREYEQHGNDRASYGTHLLETLAGHLSRQNSTGMSARSLRLYRQFYLTYPVIWQSLTAKSEPFLGHFFWQSLPAKFQQVRLLNTAVATPSPPSKVDNQTLLTNLSFTHLAELIAIDDEAKRSFYEFECLRGNWSVRELKRQVASLYYERSGLSHDKVALSALVQEGAEHAEPQLAIRDPYVFEFLGLKPTEIMGESHLEDQLLDKLQNFLLELGHGFCFEARQKRILIGGSHGFIDLVFYHRILKCHVLVELKLAGFSHENIGQLNTYVSWYRANMMCEGDSPPIGILLCTQKDHALVEYALAGMDNRLFVSRYQLELPKKEEMQRFLEEQIAAQHNHKGSPSC